jgi:RNA polymerase sigma-70 factor (ECF subfamily)
MGEREVEPMGDEFMCNDDITNIVEKYSDMVLRLAVAYLRNLEDAKDVCQEVFMRIFKNGKDFIDSDHEKAWIIRVTINVCKDVLKSQWKKRFFPAGEMILPIQDEENREVVGLVLELPVKYRTVIHLYYFENYSTYEIAKLLNKKEATIRTHLRRGRELLKGEMIGGYENA